MERTVGEVLPALEKNLDHISQFIELLGKQMVEKGKALQAYIEKHNITVRGGDNFGAPPAGADANQAGDGTENKKSSGVLVS